MGRFNFIIKITSPILLQVVPVLEKLPNMQMYVTEFYSLAPNLCDYFLINPFQNAFPYFGNISTLNLEILTVT